MLVLSGPPQRSELEAPGSAALASVVAGGVFMQPVESPGPLPRSTLVLKFFTPTNANVTDSPQRLPLASGRPNADSRVALAPMPTPANRCWKRLSYESGRTRRACPAKRMRERGSV